MRNDRDLVKGINILQIIVQQSMSCLMVGRCTLLVLCHELAFAGNAENDLVPCLLEIIHADCLPAFAGSIEGSLVDKICQISA